MTDNEFKILPNWTKRIRVSAASTTFVVLCFLLPGSSKAKSQTVASPSPVISAGIAQLQSWYNPYTGLYKTTGWWNSANALATLIAYERISGDRQFHSAIETSFNKAQLTFPLFRNQFYDDEGWWALTWLDAYELTGESKYLNMAESIFADLRGGWSYKPCQGGLWWSKKRDYKNAIPNELFLALSARLANLEPIGKSRSIALVWANREWAWFAQTGMINEDHLINDGLRVNASGRCSNNLRNPWTYNQGVILTGLVELFKATHDAALLDQANGIALAAIKHLTNAEGVLQEICEPTCGADGPQFKGIFIKNLVELGRVTKDPKYLTFAETNERSLLDMDRNSRTARFGQTWSGPPLKADASSESAALDALLAAAQLRSAK
jgi:predicted alpha-1,6-mannanase (GH76 family)